MTYALISGCMAAVVAVGAGYPFVAFLRAKKLGKAISAEGPQTHLVKAGTPTMGGLLFMGTACAIGLAAETCSRRRPSPASASPSWRAGSDARSR